MRKGVIINADDFGMSPLFNSAIVDLIKENSVTSTSVMMTRMNSTQKDHVEALKKYYKEKHISIWLHVEYVDTNFDFHLERQLDWFITVFWRNPDHIDLHVHTYLDEWYRVYCFYWLSEWRNYRICISSMIQRWSICLLNEKRTSRRYWEMQENKTVL